MSPERWQRIQDLLLAALERGPDERRTFLSEVRAGDAAVVAEVEALLRAHEQAGNSCGTTRCR